MIKIIFYYIYYIIIFVISAYYFCSDIFVLHMYRLKNKLYYLLNVLHNNLR